MNRIATACLIGLLSQSAVRADELNAQRTDTLDERGPTTVRHAITIEAARLARSAPSPEPLFQSSQASKKEDTRHWCVRHGTGCGALIGFTAGFLVGLMRPVEDFDPMGFALIFSGPIGAGIGAAVGWGIAEGTKPRQP